jgi:hypothetical protein
MLETAVAKASAAGQYFVATAANALATRTVDSDVLDSIATTTSTSYVGSGMPTVTSTCTVEAIVMLYSYCTNNTSSQTSFYGFQIGTPTSAAYNDNRAVATANFTAQFAVSASCVVLASVTAGSQSFVAGVRVTGGTGTWDHRRIAVMGF